MRQGIGGAMVVLGGIGFLGFGAWSILALMAASMSDATPDTSDAKFFGAICGICAAFGAAGYFVAR